MNRQKISRRRNAFTLVELLVVITIIGMLMALLLPAVQSAREAGRRAQCQNNQSNLAKAMIQYESTHKYFPGHLMYMTLGSKNLACNWVVPLLPYLDHSDIYAEIQRQLEAAAAGGSVGGLSATTFTKSLPIMVCPSDPPNSQGAGTAWMSYVVNRGRNGVDNEPASGVCPNHIPATTSGYAWEGNASSPAKVGLDYISSHDGASTTLLLGESLQTTVTDSTAVPTAMPYMRLFQAASGGGTPDYYFRPYSEWINGTAWSDADTAELTYGFEWSNLAKVVSSNPKIQDSINSRHPEIVVVTFCDGHQYPLNTNLNINAFKHIMTPYGAGCDTSYADRPETVAGYEVFDEGSL